MKGLALSYALKKRAKKMAPGEVHKPMAEIKGKDTNRFNKRLQGASVEHGDADAEVNQPRIQFKAHGGMVHEEDSGYESMPEEHEVMDHAAMEEDDMVHRIMNKRGYSEGGMVANGGEDDLDRMADGRPNEFDDLALRDDLEFSYTGANSGDELGNHQEDMDRKDMVARIMKSRAKKDRLPNPR